MERVVSLAVNEMKGGYLPVWEDSNGLSAFRHQTERRDRVYRLRLCRPYRARRFLTTFSNNDVKPDFLDARQSGPLQPPGFFVT